MFKEKLLYFQPVKVLCTCSRLLRTLPQPGFKSLFILREILRTRTNSTQPGQTQHNLNKLNSIWTNSTQPEQTQLNLDKQYTTWTNSTLPANSTQPGQTQPNLEKLSTTWINSTQPGQLNTTWTNSTQPQHNLDKLNTTTT